MAADPELPLKVAKLDRTTTVDFGKELMPVLKRNCIACHHKGNAEGGLVLESHASILKGGDSGTVVDVKDAPASLLMSRTTGHIDPLMPPDDNTVGAVALTAEELGLLQLWIEQGAKGSDEMGPEAIKWQPISESMRSVYAMDVSPDGQRLAFGRGNHVLVAGLENPTELSALVDSSLKAGPVADLDLIQSIAFSPDGTRIATGGFRTVRLWKQTHVKPNHVELPRLKFATEKSVQKIALDASQNAVALVNAIGDVEIWDAVTNARRVTISGQRDLIVGISWAGNTGRLLVANEAGVITAYDGANGTQIAQLDIEISLESLAACSDGVHLAVIDFEHRVHLLRIVSATEQTRASITAVTKSVGDVADATAIALCSKPALMLIVASVSRGVIVFDPVKNQVVRSLDAMTVVDALSLSSDEAKLVTGGRDAACRVWSMTDGKLLATCQGAGTQALHLAVATSHSARQKSFINKLTSKTTELQEQLKKEDESLGMIIKARDMAMAAHQANEAKLAEAVGLVTATQAVLDKAKGEVAAAEGDINAAQSAIEKATKDLETQRAEVTKLETEKVKSDAELVKQQRAVDAATLAQQRAAQILPVHEAKLQSEMRRQARLDERLARIQEQITASTSTVVDLALNAEGTHIATLHRDGSTAVYRTTDGQALSYFAPTTIPSQNVEIQPAIAQVVMIGSEIYRLGRAGVVECLWLQEQWELERTIGASDDVAILVDRVTALDFRPDGMTLAVGTGEASRSGSVKVFAVQTGELVRDMSDVHTDTVLGLEFSPDGQTLASSSADRTIQLIDVASGSITRTLEGHTHHVLSIAWQQDGRTLASAGADQSIKIWDSETGETQRTISGFSQELTSIKFVGATDQIVASCGNGQVRLASASSGATIRTLDAAKDFLFAVVPTPDGKRLVAGGESGIVRIWNLTDGAVVAELKP